MRGELLALAAGAAFCAVPAAGAPSGLEDAFSQAQTQARESADRRKAREALRKRLKRRLGPFAALLGEAGEGEGWMSAEVASRLSSGREDALVLGESHGESAEIAAGIRILSEAMSRGVRFKALLRERNTFTGDSLMASANVPVAAYGNAFSPGPELAAALGKRGPGLVASYTGNAHAAAKVKDHHLKALEGAAWLRIRDMVTVEDVLRAAGRRPLIVAMMTEQELFRRIQRLFLAELGGKGADLTAALASLEDLRDVWSELVPARSPAPGLRFLEFPGQSSLFVGLTAAPRRPLELEAVIEVLGSPEARVWAGTRPLASLESLWRSRGDGAGGTLQEYLVILRDEAGGEFRRTLPSAGGDR